MSNPSVVEVERAGRVESFHRGAAAVVDAEDAVVLAVGDVERPVFPRSAVKALQALPLIESGAADRYGFGAREIALACASHSGEPEHVALTARMLSLSGLAPDALACGVQWPTNVQASRALSREGREPSALHNNCSGKHAGFLCLACAEGLPHDGYERPEHGVQREVRATLEAMAGETLGEERRGTDGCSIPTYAISLVGLARAFARFSAGAKLAPRRAEAARRIREAVAAHPFLVGGSGRFDTQVMGLLGVRAFTKTGAEGVFCAALPELGFGLAVKADDGATRAAEIMIAALIARFLPMDEPIRSAFAPFLTPTLTNWRGLEVGSMRPARGWV